MKKILVVGANGMLGNSLACVASKNYHVIGTYHNFFCENHHNDIKLDITNKKDVFRSIAKVMPDIVVNCVAVSGVDVCEENPTLAKKVHVDGTEFLSLACKKTGSKFVHVSTDFVFDGKKGDYSENDATYPINIYGQTKLDGERKVQENDIVVRTCIFGKNVENKKSMVEWIVDSLGKMEKISVMDDSFFTPIYTTHLSNIILEMCEKGLCGLYHVASDKRIDKFSFAIAVAKVFNLDKNLIQRSSINDFKRKARRPVDTSLSCDKVKKEGIIIKDFKDEIKMMKNDKI